MVIDLQRPKGRGLCLGVRFAGRGVSPIGKNNVGVGQSRVSHGIVWILVDSLLEELNSFPQAGFGPLVPEVSAFQIELIRLHIISQTSARLLLLRLERQAQTICNRLSKF